MDDSETGKWSFGDLAVFKRAYAISLELHRVSLGFPQREQTALADQARRASKSVCALIAEGSGRQRGSPADFKRFLVMAMGSADEMRVWARYCFDLGYIDEPTWKRWQGEYQEIAKMLQGFITNLKRSKRSSDD